MNCAGDQEERGSAALSQTTRLDELTTVDSATAPSGDDGSSISIVIPHYGDPQQTKRLVNQLLEQETPRKLEIIVSDDASAIPIPGGHGYRVVRSSTNGGFGAAVNRGVHTATMPLLMILNSDIVVEPDFVEKYASAASIWMPDAICGVRLVGGNMVSQLPRRFPRNLYYFAESINALARWRHGATWKRLVGIYEDTRVPSAVDWILGAAMLLPTSTFRKANGFDERYHMYMEEVDLQFRLSQMGIRSIYLGNIQVSHGAFGSSSNSAHREVGVLNARKLYALKWRGPLGLRSLQIALSLSEFINFVSNSIRRLMRRPTTPVSQLRQRLTVIWEEPKSHRRIVH